MMNEHDIDLLSLKSEDIEYILSMIDRSSKDLDACLDTVHETEDECMDILHELELKELSYHERAHLAERLVELRKLRRRAKDEADILTPFVNWVEADRNRKTIEDLRKTLGTVRIVEHNHENRIYTKRAGAQKGEIIV